MSARGRTRKDGTKAAKRKHEFFETSGWTVDTLLGGVPAGLLPVGNWLDPCAGRGAISEAVERWCHPNWTNYDIDPVHTEQWRGVGDLYIKDFLEYDPGEQCLVDVAIMNPPFSLALQFVVACRKVAHVTVMLQRVGWLGPARRGYINENMPDVYLLPRRPSFTGGGTDSTEYAWFVWDDRGHEAPKTEGTIRMLPRRDKP